MSCVCIRHHLDRLPPQLRDRFTQDLTALAARDAQPYTLDYWRLNIDARKAARVIAHYEQQVGGARRARRSRSGGCRSASRAGGWRRSSPGRLLTSSLFARGPSPAAVSPPGLTLLLVFAVLVVWHARVDERVDWHDALHAVNHSRAGANRPGLGSAASGRRAARRDRASPVRAGSRSLRPRVAAAVARSGRDRRGRRTLQDWLLHPRRPPISPLASARADLAPALEWREHFAAHGRLASGVRAGGARGVPAWAESPGPFAAPALRRLRVAVLLTTAAIWLLILLHGWHWRGACWLVPITLGMILSFATARWVHGEFNRAIVGEQAFERYAGLFVHVTAAPRNSALLEDIQSRLGARGYRRPAACAA